MRRKYEFLIITAFVVFLILYLGKREIRKEAALDFSNAIQYVEIIDGSIGEKVLIEKADEWNDIITILQESKIITNSNSEDTTGYQWRVIIKSQNHLTEITGPEHIIYDNEKYKFSNRDDYMSLEQCVSRLYAKYNGATNKKE